ncbi:MAG: RecX family transcriptional regulator, partial [Dehalococcoidia bacterium]
KVSIYIDHSYSFSLDKETAIHAGMQKGKEIPEYEIDELKRSSHKQECLNAALNFLGYRPRSELEVRLRLRRRGFDEEAVNEAIVRLKRQSLIDDLAFAQYWKENRLSFRPKSKKLIKRELLQKGISSEIAGDVVDDVNDEESAYKVAQKKARTLTTLDYNEFRNRLAGFLRWKGYSYDIIEGVTSRLWQEKHAK